MLEIFDDFLINRALAGRSMFFSISWTGSRQRASLSSWAKLRIVRRGAALAPVLLLHVAAANATPLVPSPGCAPAPYSTGDLTCTNAGTVNVTGADGIDAPANNGNSTTTNSGTVNVSGGNVGIRTTTDIGNATTTNQGSVNISGNSVIGILTQVTTTGNATTNNSGTVNVNATALLVQSGDNPGDGVPILFNGVGGRTGISTLTFSGNATTNNSGNVNVTSFGSAIGINTTAVVLATQPADGATIPAGGDATTTNSGNVVVSTTALPPGTQPADTFAVALGATGS
jgi:hypothetical protein